MKEITPYIQAYINNWAYINTLEEYKWIAIKHFQEKFFASDISFTEKLSQSLSRTGNLLVAPRYFPSAMLIEFCQEKPTLIESMINNLFNENNPLRDRIIKFMDKSHQLIIQMTEEGHGDWKVRDNVQSFQDAHAISVYLTLRYPDNYYIYKYGVFRDFSKRIGYTIQNGNSVDRYLEYNSLCKSIKKEIQKEREFISFYETWTNENGYKDPNYNLLTQDFIYSVASHLNPEKIDKKDKKKSIVKEIQEIEVHDFPFVKSKFKGSKNVDYAKRDALYRSLGMLGEQWVITYEKERLAKLGIQAEVRHSSVCDGDGIGYDVLSVEDDGITPRYIEVKTTTGDVRQPFFYSDNELQFSEGHKENYYLYRVYDFVGSSKKANLLIIHGNLKQLNGKPISYKVSVK